MLSRVDTQDIDMLERHRGAYLARRRECGLALYVSVGIEKGDRAGAQGQALENFFFLLRHMSPTFGGEADAA